MPKIPYEDKMKCKKLDDFMPIKRCDLCARTLMDHEEDLCDYCVQKEFLRKQRANEQKEREEDNDGNV